MSVLTVVRSDVTKVMPVPISIGVCFVPIPRLRALLNRVSPLWAGRSLPRLDPSYLVDLDFGLWRVLNVDIYQGWVEGHLLIGQW